jgi:hypothetical protein
MIHWLLFLSIVRLAHFGQAGTARKLDLFDFTLGSKSGSKSLRKLKILVVDWGIIDTGTGASKRHLGILASLAYLGHEVTRAAARVGTKKQPLDSKIEAFLKKSGIKLYKPRLVNGKKHSASSYVSLVKALQPDVVFMTLWFCGETLSDTTPGYLLKAHRKANLQAKVIVESSDVHAARLKHQIDFLSGDKGSPWFGSWMPLAAPQAESDTDVHERGKEMSRVAIDAQSTGRAREVFLMRALLSRLRVEEAQLYHSADAVATISHEDSAEMHKLLAAYTPANAMSTLSSSSSSSNGSSREREGLRTPGSKVVLPVRFFEPMVTASTSGLSSPSPQEGQSDPDQQASIMTCEPHLVFVGPAAVPTNYAALEWFFASIWPKLNDANIGTQLTVVGNGWRKFVKRARRRAEKAAGSSTAILPETALATAVKCAGVKLKPECASYRHVHWPGRLSEDSLSNMLRGKGHSHPPVFISPIFFSTGLNTKNVLALAHGLPLVTTRAGAGGLCRLGPDAADFCASVAPDPDGGEAVGGTGSRDLAPFLVTRATSRFNTSSLSQTHAPWHGSDGDPSAAQEQERHGSRYGSVVAPPGDAAIVQAEGLAFAVATSVLLADCPRRRAMGQRARAFAQKELTLTGAASDMRSLLTTVLGDQ